MNTSRQKKTEDIVSDRHSDVIYKNEVDLLPDVRELIRSICSHDIKSPLSAILESCSMLFEENTRNPLEKELMKNIEEAIYRVFEMVHRIHMLVLLQNKQVPFHDRPINLISCVQALKHTLKYKLNEKKITMIVKSAGDNIVVSSKRLRMRGGEAIVSAILQHFIQVVIDALPSGNDLQVEVVFNDSAGIRILGACQLPQWIPSTVKNTKHIGSKKDVWPIIYSLMRMTGAVVNYQQNEQQSSITIHFPVEEPQSVDCVQAC